MPFDNLRTKDLTQINENNHSVLYLNLQKVFCLIDGGENQFPKGKVSDDPNAINLMNFIIQGNNLIPPRIIKVLNGPWAVYDGQHRIGISRYLNLLNIPFLIKKCDLSFAEELK